jgi:hypothetical protein
MENLNKTTTNSKEWQPNAKQKEFLESLKDYPDGVTLKDLEIEKGKKFATGTINTLVSHGLVETVDSDGLSADIVYKGVVIGSKKLDWKIYKLA